MAAGDSKIFNDFALKLAKKTYDLSSGGDAFAISFIATAFASVDADATNPHCNR